MTKKNKVLIAEDDPFIGMITKECFESKGYKVFLCDNGEAAYTIFIKESPDICILDVMMPLKDGFTLASEIRSLSPLVPILFLTARSLKEDIIKGFQLGADDYIKKPFSVEELIARVEAVLRRIKPHIIPINNKVVYHLGVLSFDSDFHLLRSNSREIKLTDKESGILNELCKNKNNITDRKSLLIKIWGDDSFFNSRSLDVYITKIRKYLRQDPNIELVTVRGKGYKLWTGNKKAFDDK
tara:strand:- start:119 stop:838 length:720 start_codon:yes stop_codon:yes gene_type:complete